MGRYPALKQFLRGREAEWYQNVTIEYDVQRKDAILQVTRYFINSTTITATPADEQCEEEDSGNYDGFIDKSCIASPTRSNGLTLSARTSTVETIHLTHPKKQTDSAYATSKKRLHNLMADQGFRLKTGEYGRHDIKIAIQQRRNSKQRQEENKNLRLLEFFRQERFFIHEFRRDVLWKTTTSDQDFPFPTLCTSKTRLYDSLLLENYRHSNGKALLDSLGLEMPQHVVAHSMSVMPQLQNYFGDE